ncbi:type III-B CRISPR module RAMP protein Cmr1 [Psychrobacter alimentarius]|uniref:type III-B CRISPR module RAMP protein Cmr1 n=1 Tax=Psychrobacter alimentarius TaxID=261164 RepID=UPI003FD0D8C8
MSLRIPDDSIEIPSLTDIEPVLEWHTLSCELVTPMYGGGVKSVVVDEQMPIRTSSIRGQLRFWWRLLAKHKWELGTDEDIQQQEFSLWGGMGSGDEDGTAGQVFLRVSDVPSSSKIRQSLIDYDDNSLSQLRYVLFPAYNETNPKLQPHRLLKPEIRWKLAFAFSSLLDKDNTKKEQVIETLRWWASFDGLGFRSRKGLGSVRVTESTDYPQIAQIPSPDDIAEANCHLIQRNSTSSALSALNSAISKLSEFRQSPGVGRNPGQQRSRPGRSRWPEPDALRRINKTHHSDHAPEHSAGNVFPRAIFGMPILFPFVGRNEPSGDNIVSPAQGERLASPLILRAVYAGDDKDGKAQWQPSALALPYQHILDMQVTVGRNEYPVWKSDTAEHTRPISENGGQDPIQAFLTYFAK